MASRTLNAEALPALEPLGHEGVAPARHLHGLGSWARGALLLDGLMLVAAAVVSELTAAKAGIVSTSPVWLLVYSALTLALLARRGLYDWRLRLSVLDNLGRVVTATALASMVVLALRILLPGDVDDLAPQALRLFAFSVVYLAAGRLAFDWTQLVARRQGEAVKPTLIVGAGRVGALTARRLLAHPELGLRPVGFLDKEPLEQERLPLPVLGASWDLERLIEQHRIEHLVVAFSTAPSEVLLREVERCEALGVSVSLVPRLFERVTERLSVEHIGGLPLLSARRSDPRGRQVALKYALDRLLAALLLLLALPLLGLLALATLCSLGRPLFFRQPRLGLDGRQFEMLKFRSMRGPGAPARLPELAPDTAPGGIEGEDRRTRLGSFLRRTSLDELPQLVNVLRGEMSLVGPRPERPEFARRFQASVYRYAERQRVKSGITGWAQVHGLRGKTSLADRVEWDNFYIENWSLWLDLKILLLTCWAVVGYFGKAE